MADKEDSCNYSKYIDGIIQKRGQWKIPEGEYFESHHILPKCMGGEGKQYSKHHNIIWLYPEEHFIAHKLLNKEYSIPFPYLNSFTAEEFGEMRRKAASKDRDSHIGKNKGSENPNFGNHKIAGKNHFMYGKHHTEETKQKIRESQKEYFSKHDAPNKGKTFSDKWKKHIKESHADTNGEKNPMWGKSHSDSTKQKISEFRKGRKAITNGVKNMTIASGDTLPPGWRYGLTRNARKV